MIMKHIVSILVLVLAWGPAQAVVLPSGKSQAAVDVKSDIKLLKHGFDIGNTEFLSGVTNQVELQKNSEMYKNVQKIFKEAANKSAKQAASYVQSNLTLQEQLMTMKGLDKLLATPGFVGNQTTFKRLKEQYLGGAIMDLKILQDALDAAYNFELQAINEGLKDIKARQESKQLAGATQQQIDAAIKDLTDKQNKLKKIKNGLKKVLDQAAQAQTKKAAQDLIKKFISSDNVIKKADYQELMKNGLALLVQSKGLVGVNIARLEQEYFDVATQVNAGKFTL